MPQKKIHTLRRTLLGLTAVLGVLSAGIIATAVSGVDIGSLGERMEGRLLPRQLRQEQVWETITAEEMREGDTVQPHVNTIIHIPPEVKRITRRTLLGRTGERIRYWGYCFPQTYEEMEALKRRGYPGTLFLSEKERAEQRAIRAGNRRTAITSLKDLTEENLNQTQPRQYNAIRHQQEIFTGGMACYIMANGPLPIGTDEDGDSANAKVEDSHGTDVKKADTDGDGLNDGLEIFYVGSHPDKRDTDGDGIIDGVEDTNRNGRLDAGESNPTVWDTDRDGLCDGLCKVKHSTKMRGEDVNLNGKVDEGEFDPTKEDTDGDGILDEQEYFNCQLSGEKDC